MDRVVSRELEDGVVGFLNHDGVYYKWMESDVLKLMRLDSPNHMLNLYESLKIDHMFVRWRALEPGQPPVPYHSDHTCVIEFKFDRMSRPSGCVIGGTGYSHVNIDNIVAKMRDLKLSELISDASWDGGHEVYNYFNKL